MKVPTAKAGPSWSQQYVNGWVSPPRKHTNIYLKLIQLTVFSNIKVMYPEIHKKLQRPMTFLKCELRLTSAMYVCTHTTSDNIDAVNSTA